MADKATAIGGWEKALMAAERVKERCRRATGALDAAGIAYAVVGGNAVAEWVARVDEGAVRNTRDVDILVRRADFAMVKSTLESAGFVHHHLLDVDGSSMARTGSRAFALCVRKGPARSRTGIAGC